MDWCSFVFPLPTKDCKTFIPYTDRQENGGRLGRGWGAVQMAGMYMSFSQVSSR